MKDSLLFNGKSKIKNIVFPKLSENLSLAPMKVEDAEEKIFNSMKILKETPEFTEINFIFPKKDIKLDRKIKCYELSYKNLEDVKSILKKIL